MFAPKNWVQAQFHPRELLGPARDCYEHGLQFLEDSASLRDRSPISLTEMGGKHLKIFEWGVGTLSPGIAGYFSKPILAGYVNWAGGVIPRKLSSLSFSLAL